LIENYDSNIFLKYIYLYIDRAAAAENPWSSGKIPLAIGVGKNGKFVLSTKSVAIFEKPMASLAMHPYNNEKIRFTMWHIEIYCMGKIVGKHLFRKLSVAFWHL